MVVQSSSRNRSEKKKGPVNCLGMTFEKDEFRRAYFTEELRKKLPELRKMEGFPIGEDEDILTLSDPPCYTACPNPFISQIIKEWEEEKKKRCGNRDEGYHRKPFAADVSEGKNNPIYHAHTYHTKVPHRAIMRYILHYTDPGDIVFDGFCGTGMTGVAAQLCKDREAVESLGYRVLEDGTILDEEGQPFSKLGERKAVLNDLSPAATFIAYNYNTPMDAGAFRREAERVLKEVEKECGWMYETRHVMDGVPQLDEDGNPVMGKINYILWSDVFSCPECTYEIVYFETYKRGNQITCKRCGIALTRKKMERVWAYVYDTALKKTIRQAKQIPVQINYSIGTKRFNKEPDRYDLETIKKIEDSVIPYWFPTNELPFGHNTQQPMKSHGFTHVHHFYTKRNLWVLSCFWSKLGGRYKWILTSFIARNVTKMNRFVINKHNPEGRINGPLTGTLYVPSLIVEQSALQLFRDKMFRVDWDIRGNLIQSASTSDLKNLPDESVDYVFLDPPFGANIMYSELNILWESWLKTLTNPGPEAIQNRFQNKELEDYRMLMTRCFKEVYRVLKPNRWVTIEFSNTQTAVWNALQTAIQDAGFVVANVSILDKKHGGIKAMSNTVSVKQDLIISVYKPLSQFFKGDVRKKDIHHIFWEFVDNYLCNLPVFREDLGRAGLIPEREPRILYDKVVSFFVRNGLPIPMSSSEFQRELQEKYPMRDGMVFLDTQVPDYDKKRRRVRNFPQLHPLVTDENSAIDWLRQQLLKKPQTYQDLYPDFRKEAQYIAKYEALPELKVLLDQNFLCYEGDGPIPDQIQRFLNKNYPGLRPLDKDDPKRIEKAMNRWYVPDPDKLADLEKLREKALLKEFHRYRGDLYRNKKKLKVFRTEAIRAGFKKAWSEKDYRTIVEIGERLPESVINEDDKLLMYFNNAQIRLGL